MKPYQHSESSVQKWGGKVSDYLKIHDWFDQTKAFVPTQLHRCILHNAFGIFLCEQVFGAIITNSDGKVVSVRDIGEQHVLEDFGGKFIPTLQDWVNEIALKDWMRNGQGFPPSYAKITQPPIAKDFFAMETHDSSDIVVDGTRSLPLELPKKPTYTEKIQFSD